jgi:hypothetical protein
MPLPRRQPPSVIGVQGEIRLPGDLALGEFASCAWSGPDQVDAATDSPDAGKADE